MDEIKNCEWLDEQPGFLKDVIIDGKKIATIHALTKLDLGEIRRKANTKTEYNVETKKMYVISNVELIEVAQMYQSLIGYKEAGWTFSKPVTEANINHLPKKYFKAITDAIVELGNQNDITGGQSKN